MKNKVLESLINEVFSSEGSRNWQMNLRLLPRRLGYVFSLFCDGITERAIIRDVENEMGWRNSRNWGYSVQYSVLFDLLCPVIRPALAYVKGGRQINEASIRTLNPNVAVHLIELVRQHHDLVNWSDNEVANWCIEFWAKNTVEELADLYRVEAEAGWSWSSPKQACSSRVYHPLVGTKKAIRDAVLLALGYSQQYDIKSCHPVLLWQAWDRLPWGGGLSALGELVSAPDAFRVSVASWCGELLGIDPASLVPTVKTCLSALLHDTIALPDYATVDSYRAVVSMRDPRRVVSVWTEFAGGDVDTGYHLYNRFRTCVLVVRLARDYALMRKLLSSKLRTYRSDETELAKLAQVWGVDMDRLKLVASSKNPLYWLAELLEERVVRVLMEIEPNVFRIHDCVATRSGLAVQELETKIHTETGYRVKLSRTKL